MVINPIKDIQILNEIIQGCFNKSTITNNYVLADAYLHYIADNKLFYSRTGDNACILVEKANYYQLYYYINNNEELMTIYADKPVTMEILYRGEAKRPVEILAYWEKCGFKRHLTRDIMMATYHQMRIPSTNEDRIEIRYAETKDEILFTKELIENTLDKYTGDILTYKEVQAFVENKNVICAYWEGKLCGILQFEIKNNVVWLGHIAIAHEFRGKGIANELVKTYIVDNEVQLDTRYQLWVIQDNLAAKTLYQKFGFIYGNKSTASMLKY